MATINLGARPYVPGNPGGMSAGAALAAAHAEARAAVAPPRAAWVQPGAWRRRSRHAVDDTRHAVVRAFLLAIAGIAWLAVTISNITREWGMHAATCACFIVAGFCAHPTLGWTVAGVALLVTQGMTREE